VKLPGNEKKGRLLNQSSLLLYGFNFINNYLLQF